MTNDPSVINLKDLRKKADVSSSSHFDVPQNATVVLRPAPVPAAVSTPAYIPKVAIPQAPPSAPAKVPQLVREMETPARRPSFVAPVPKKPATRLKMAAYAFTGLVLLAAVGTGGHYAYVHVWTVSPFEPSPGVSTPTPSAESAAASAAAAVPATSTSSLSQSEIISRVQKLMLVPQGEEPVLAAVSDPSALSDQAFFKNAKIGDVVLMYAKARRAILYDPANDKVLEVAPITDTPVK